MYAYFVFQIFLLIYETLKTEKNRKQIIKTSLSLHKMPELCQRIVIPDLIRISRILQIYSSSKRKTYMCSKKEGKMLESDAVKHFKNRMKKNLK